ncbi:MAG: DUF5018 domain-containing protein [Tannerellaceae bacterium]|jgi:hypothetical protein|nr:DUF5018 domain-containing protein [Tannerellaceae bacterium]
MKHERLLFLILLIFITSCGSDDEPEVLKSSEKQLVEFAVSDAKGTIDENMKTVTIRLTESIDIKQVRPAITISKGATVFPESGEAVDLSHPVTYTVTAEDASRQEYTVTAQVLPFDFRINSISTTKARADQIFYINGTFSDDPELMGVYLTAGETRTACRIGVYTPSLMRVAIDKNMAAGLYDLTVVYYGKEEIAITYPDPVEITDLVPSVSFLSAYTLDAATDALFITGKNFKLQKEEQANVRFSERGSTETAGNEIYLPGNVYSFGDLDIIHIGNLKELGEKAYTCTVFIDGVMADYSNILYFEKDPKRPEIQSVSNLNPSEGERITLTGSGFGYSSYILFYAQVIEGLDLYLPIYQITESIYRLTNGKEYLQFNMPKVGDITKYKVKVSYYSIDSDFSEIITVQ